jgi:hypothetical protein
MYKAIVSVKANDDYTLLISLEDDEKRILDMRPFLSIGRFEELKSKEKFKDVRVSFDTVEWGNGLDLDPEFINDKSKKIDSQ